MLLAIVNLLKQGFNVDTNAATVVAKDGTYKKFPLQSKRQLADGVVAYTTKGLMITKRDL